MIRAKIHNQRVMLMRNGDVAARVLSIMGGFRDATERARDITELRASKERRRRASSCPCYGRLVHLILAATTRNIRNGTYRDVTQFLKEHGFEYYKSHRGSHQLWINYGQDGTPDRMVEVNFAHTAYKVETLKTMMKQSGI